MTFTRTGEDSAIYASARGCWWRLLASPGTPGAWMLIPAVVPPQPAFYAVPQAGGYGLEIRRGSPAGELVGYAMNLADATWPAEADLITRGIPPDTAAPPGPALQLERRAEPSAAGH